MILEVFSNLYGRYKVKAGGELGELHWLFFFKLMVDFAWTFDSAVDHNISALQSVDQFGFQVILILHRSYCL